MIYEVLLANGNELINKKVDEVQSVDISEDSYSLYDTSSNIIFVAPVNSVVYIGLV